MIIFLVILLIYFTSLPFLHIERLFDNRFNDYKILSIKYNDKQYYSVKIVWHHMFGFIKLYHFYCGSLSWDTKGIKIEKPHKMTLFENVDDLKSTMNKLYREYNPSVEISEYKE